MVTKRKVDVASFYLVNSNEMKFVTAEGTNSVVSSYCLPYLDCSLVFMDSAAVKMSHVTADRGWFLDCRVSLLTAIRLSVSMYSPASMLVQKDNRFSQKRASVIAESVAAVLAGKRSRIPYPQIMMDAMLNTAAEAIKNMKCSDKIEYITSETYDFNRASAILEEMATNAAEAHR